MNIQSSIKRSSKIALCALVGVAALVSVLIVGVSSNNVNASVAAGAEATVHICTGSYASAYHKTSKCRGLGNCKATVKSVTRSSAINAGRKACKICW